MKNQRAPFKPWGSDDESTDESTDEDTSSESSERQRQGGWPSINPFFNFLRDFRLMYPLWNSVRIAVEGAKSWALMDDKEKLKYRLIAQEMSKLRKKAKELIPDEDFDYNAGDEGNTNNSKSHQNTTPASADTEVRRGKKRNADNRQVKMANKKPRKNE